MVRNSLHIPYRRIITNLLIHPDPKGEYKNLWDTYVQHRRKMDMPSGSGASEEPNWAYWKDFSKYINLPRYREPVGSFTKDLLTDSRKLGPEDNYAGQEVEDEDDVVFVEDNTVSFGDQVFVVGTVPSTDPLSSKTWKAPPPAKRRRKETLPSDNELKDMLITLESLIKEDTPKTSQDMMRRSLVDGVQALLMDVSDTSTLARLSVEVLGFVSKRVEELKKI